MPDGGAGTARPCECRRQNHQFGLLSAAQVPDRYQSCRLSTFKIEGPKEVQGQILRARFTAQRYINDFMTLQAEIGGKAGLVFTGPPGVGKTHLAVAVLIEIIERYKIPGRFIELNEFVAQMRATFAPAAPETMQDVIEPVLEAPLLVLDELGSQKKSDWLNDLLYLIVNTRYTRRRPTIFTTNYRLPLVTSESNPFSAAARPKPLPENLDRGRDPDPKPKEEVVEKKPDATLLSWRVPPMIISRLYEMAEIVRLDAVIDYRRRASVP